MISVIIINYNRFELTCACIQSILKYSEGVDYEIILVDNASSECDPNLFLSRFPDVKLIKSDANLGFAKGNNLGIAHAKGDIILLLNNDTYFIENSLKIALTAFSERINVGFLGVKMKYPDGRIQHTARRFRSIQWELLDLFRFLLYLLPYATRAKLMLGKYFNSDFDTEADWLNGAFLMFRKEVLNALSGEKLDEQFFMYGEDHLWAYQFSKLNLVNYFSTATTIVHIENASTSAEKRLSLRKIMFKNELAIMKVRKGIGVYYAIFKILYGAKEYTRIFIKSLVK